MRYLNKPDSRHAKTLVAAGALALSSASGASAAACAPPPGFVDAPAPRAAPIERLVSHTEEIMIDRPLDHVLRVGNATSLEDIVQNGGSLPTVSGTYVLTPGKFHLPGSRRIVCLSDGSTLVEEVLFRNQRPSRAEFRYVVWNYSTEQARAIEHGVGQFMHTELGDGRTHVRWTYGFQLRRNRFPGFLGPIGDFFFRKFFLEGDYAEMMRSTLASEKLRAERPR